MNAGLQEYARKEIKKGLAELTDVNRRMFKMMYGAPKGKPAKTGLAFSIDEIVDNMPEEELDLALSQVHRTLKRKQ